ncbi:MAG: UDP-N-acetylmuramoyl-tripeptide--D-alanyl-D-alanine ligase [Candidatus Binatia bacterium]
MRDGRKARFGEIVTDSTKVRRGAVFLALKGERHDGHRFVGAAVQGGAACVIVQRALPAKIVGQATAVQVTDTLVALGDLAHHRRQKIAPKVLAVTGSNGKTTTKEMIAAILEEATLDGRPLRGRVLKTEGNFNNLVGLPLTLLGLRRQHRVAVVELGTNHPGEIQRLAEIAEPDMGIITSVGAAHLEGLNSLAGVAREKGSLYRNIRPGGAIAVNLDDPWTSRLGAHFKGQKFTYGKRGQVRAVSTQMRGPGGMDVVLQAGRRRCKVRLNYLGQHNIANALGAAALTLGAGVSLAAVRRGLEKVRPFSMRMQVEEWHGIGVINDTYNANPASMKAALTTLAEIPSKGAKIAVLGDMFELGKHSVREHRQLGRAAAGASLNGLYLLGVHADQVRRGALAGAMGADKIVIGENHAELAHQLGDRVKRGDWLLFKGSRGMAMEKVLYELQRRRA